MLTEIIVKLAFEATAISTAVAGARRVVGFNFPRILYDFFDESRLIWCISVSRIKNDQVRVATERYLDLGEYCLDQSVKVLVTNSEHFQG